MEKEAFFNLLQESGLCAYEAIAFQNLIKKLNLTQDQIITLLIDPDVPTS